jgi:hypothetical protein
MQILLQVIARLEHVTERLCHAEDRLDRQRRPFGDGFRDRGWRRGAGAGQW